MHITSLPPELIHEILYHLPLLDHYPLKLAGSRYITEILRIRSRRISYPLYSEALELEYADRHVFQCHPPWYHLGHHRSHHHGHPLDPACLSRCPPTTALKISLDRNQLGLLLRFFRTIRDASKGISTPASTSTPTPSPSPTAIRPSKLPSPGFSLLELASTHRLTHLTEVLLAHATALQNKSTSSPSNKNALITQYKTKAFHAAIAGSSWAMIPLFLAHGIPANSTLSITQWHETSLLHAAVQAGSIPTVRALVERGADVSSLENTRGCTPVHEAVYRRDERALAALLARPGAAALADAVGDTPLHSAAMRPEYMPRAIIDLLARYGADVNARASEERLMRTPLQYAARRRGAQANFLSWLLAAGAEADARDSAGNTALLLAVKTRKEASRVRVLLDYGADIEAQNDEGMSALHLALVPRSSRSRPASRLLLQRSEARPGEIVALLIRRGAGVGLRDRKGWAVRHVELECAKALLKHGADIHARDAGGRTPLDYAAERKEVCKEDKMHSILMSYGTGSGKKDGDGVAPKVVYTRDLGTYEIRRSFPGGYG